MKTQTKNILLNIIQKKMVFQQRGGFEKQNASDENTHQKDLYK